MKRKVLTDYACEKIWGNRSSGKRRMVWVSVREPKTPPAYQRRPNDKVGCRMEDLFDCVPLTVQPIVRKDWWNRSF